MRALKLLALCCLALLWLTPAPAHAGSDEIRFAVWSDATALSIAPQRLEVGVLSQTAWGLSRRVEARVHPVGLLIFPHAEVKLRLLPRGRLQVSSMHRLSYPSHFMRLVSRSGSGGLLPPDTATAESVMTDNDLLVSYEWQTAQWVTARIGASVAATSKAPKTTLDFPFLYQRLAALHSYAVPRAAIQLSGSLLEQLTYEAEVEHYRLLLRDAPNTRATEYGLKLHIALGLTQRLSVGARIGQVEFPVGPRTHWLPFLDYRLAFW